MTKRRRILSLSMAILVCLILLLSAVYIVVESDHTCVEDCPICTQIGLCADALKKIGAICVVAFVLLATTYVIHRLFSFFAHLSVPQTLISLMVKLSD